MTMKPIPEYEAYSASESGNVFGLKARTREAIVFEDTEGVKYKPDVFFVKDGTVFFSITVNEVKAGTDPVEYEKKTYYFFQAGGEITEDTSGSFPSEPASIRKEMGISPFSIVTGDYNGTAISSVKQNIDENINPVKNFLFVDGYFYVNDGLWFSVPDGITGAEKGLYFWAIGSGGPYRASDYGRIW